MNFARRFILFFYLPLLCAAFLAQRPLLAQSASPSVSGQSGAQSAYTLPPEKLAKAIALARIRNVLGFAGSLWQLFVLGLLLVTPAAARLEAWLQRIIPPRKLAGVLRSLCFFVLLLLALNLASLPLALYGHSVSLRYGISVQGWTGWWLDLLKGFAVSLAILSPLLTLFSAIVRRWPRRYWLVAWAATLPLLLLGTVLAPLLDPFFNQFEPLSQSHPALAAQLEKVVARTGTRIPPERMFLMKASGKTNGLNAYVTGIGPTKRIVVWDTTAGRIPDDEILFVFAHESGHYVLNHIPKGLALSAVSLFFLYRLLAVLAAPLARRLAVRRGFSNLDSVNPLSTCADFLVLLFLLSVAQFLSEPIANAVSRHFEHQADVYGQEAIHGIVADPQRTAVAAFNHLGEAWLEDPKPSPFIEFWSYTHPSTQHRAQFAQHYSPWTADAQPEFFSK